MLLGFTTFSTENLNYWFSFIVPTESRLAVSKLPIFLQETDWIVGLEEPGEQEKEDERETSGGN